MRAFQIVPRNMKKGSFLRFGVVGVANTIVGLLVIWGTKSVVGLSDVAANCCGYAAGLASSFMLNKLWTFEARGKTVAGLVRFTAVFAFSYLSNLGTVLSCIRLTTINPLWCQVIGVIPYSVLLYLGCRWYAFRVAPRRP